jgi:hypothetical protein
MLMAQTVLLAGAVQRPAAVRFHPAGQAVARKPPGGLRFLGVPVQPLLHRAFGHRHAAVPMQPVEGGGGLACRAALGVEGQHRWDDPQWLGLAALAPVRCGTEIRCGRLR